MYNSLVHHLLREPDYVCSPRGQLIYEIVDHKFTVLLPEETPVRTFDEDRNKIIADYTAKEMALYASGSRLVADFEKASKFWAKLANPDLDGTGATVNSNYGWLLFHKADCGNVAFEHWAQRNADGLGLAERKLRTPWEWAKRSLLTDRDSRQAILLFARPEFLWVGNLDQVCTLHAQFLIRDGKLHLSTVMRSQDVWFGLTYDCVYFCHLVIRMLAELKACGMTNLTLGHWTHYVHSLHIYDRNLVDIMKAVGFGAPGAVEKRRQELQLRRTST